MYKITQTGFIVKIYRECIFDSPFKIGKGAKASSYKTRRMGIIEKDKEEENDLQLLM